MGMFDSDTQKNNARKGGKAAKKKIRKGIKAAKREKEASSRDLDKAARLGRADLSRGEQMGITAITNAAKQGRKDLIAGKTEGLGYLDKGTTGALGQYQKALDTYAPLQQQADLGAEKYGNFFGLGGQQGFDTAVSEWEASPIFQAMTDANRLGIQGLDRQANARGNPYNFTDQSNYLQDSASKYLSTDYIGGLRPYLDQQGQYAGAQANIYGHMGDTLYNSGAAKGGMATDASQNLSGLGQWGGGAQAGIRTGVGGQQADLLRNTAATKATGVNVPLTQSMMGSYNTMGQVDSDKFANITAAQNAATQNKWAAINAGIGAVGTIGGAWLGA
jgi:hypothetical protein